MRNPIGSTAAQPPPRRKGAATRAWLVISDSGNSHFEEVGKHSIMRRTGLPARDLRILDPVLLYPSTILGRERAIVVNMEHIKAIITATEVLVLNSKDPLVAPFVRDLEHRVSNSNRDRPLGTEGSHTDLEGMGNATAMFPMVPASNETSEENHSPLKNINTTNEMNDNSPRDRLDAIKAGGPHVLPFEFKALEVCLESSCRRLETETSTLEQEAYPALDELTSKISTLNLQRVRHIKSRLVALFGRVQKVRDELENLLDDDMDMAEMYLTDKLVNQQAEDIAPSEEVNNDASELDDESDDDSNKSNSANTTGFKPNIEELEMLLEAYFAQIEGTLNKLSTMREYVDDTEDYINIMLDDKQNQLLQMGVLLSTANLLINAGIVVVGLFGMNITIDIFADDTPKAKFWETTFGTVAGVVLLYIISIYFGKKGGVLG
ncbi:hypothetical protein AQUCO_01400218v1 [Aquilegia coerulea]|uniref:Magnesium transporter n=1 Tax=Aquilegia coerulea TaxID=218851 RepID=A0A2G5DV78_AQUCA|nr:hypothetical protein AQUCO_01400218v1 [Aquilegia coerulea]